jgi:hypothetical protein
LPPLLRMLIFALLAPEAAGENVILNVALPPAAIDAILVGENANSALDDVTPETLRVPVPVFDIVTACAAEVLPTVWLPYVRVAGDTLSTGATPVPDALTIALPALLVMLTVALFAPELPGLKDRVNVWLPAAATLKGKAGAARM